MAAHAHSTPHENSKLTRRTLVGSLAALATAGVAEPAAPASTTLAELLADLHWKRHEWEAAHEVFTEALESVDAIAPKPKVIVGHLLKGTAEDGSRIREPQFAHSLETIEKTRDRWTSGTWLNDDAKASYHRTFDAMADEFRGLAAARERAEDEANLPRLSRLEDLADDSYLAAQEAVFAYWPVDSAERAAKATYLVELLLQNNEFSSRDLAAIFGATPQQQDAAQEHQLRREEAYFAMLRAKAVAS